MGMCTSVYKLCKQSFHKKIMKVDLLIQMLLREGQHTGASRHQSLFFLTEEERRTAREK